MYPFSTLSYALAALAFGALGLLLVLPWRQRLKGSLLRPAVFVTAAWALLLAVEQQAAGRPWPLPTLVTLDVLCETAWIAVLFRLLAGLGARVLPRWLKVTAVGGSAAVLLVGLALGVLHDQGYPAPVAERVLMGGALGLAVLGFVLIEQLYRNVSAAQAWAARPLWLGLGFIFAYDLYLYSVSVLFSRIDKTAWEARGLFFVGLAVVIGLGVRRVPAGSLRLTLSPRVVFYSIGTLTAGIYLLVVAVTGYYVQVFGGTWGGALEMVLLSGAVFALASVISSRQAQAWLRVIVAKNFFASKYDYRAEWLRLIATLDTPGGDRTLAERSVIALAQIVNSAAGGVWLRHDERGFVASGGDLAGLAAASEPADSAFMQFIRERAWIVNIDQQRRSPAKHEPSAPLPAWLLNIERAWLVVPLLRDQDLIGFVVIARPLVPLSVTWEELDFLRTAGRQVASYVAVELAADALAQSQQFAAYNRMTAFLMHDLKNLAAQLTLVVRNAVQYKHNPEFVDDAITTIDNSVKRLNRLLEQFRRGGGGDGAARRVDVTALCREAVDRCADRLPRPHFESKVTGVEAHLNPERFVAALEHVLRNAQDASSRDGRVTMELRQAAQLTEIEVCDKGRGMDAAFVRERLFKPFDTTRGDQGMGIGAYQAREYVRQAGGDVRVESEPGRGTRFIILLPAARIGETWQDDRQGATR